MNNQDNDKQGFASSSSAINIDYKRVLSSAMQYWYLILLSLSIALTIAYIRNRYAPRIYPVTASLIIKETEETGGAELLYKNALIDPYKNYFNELYLIRSYPLIQSVLEDLNFGVQFYKEGKILTSEVYNELPVRVKIINQDEIQFFRVYFKIIDDNTYELQQSVESSADQRKQFNFGDSIDFEGATIKIDVKNVSLLRKFIGSPLVLSYTSPPLLTGEYVGKLDVTWAEEGAGIIYLSVKGTNPVKDIDFINGLIRRYQKYDLEKKNLAATRTMDFINDQLATISDSLQHVESILERFKGKNVVTDLSLEASRLYEKLESIELQRSQFIVKKSYYKYLIEYISKDQNLEQVILPSSLGMDDPVLVNFLSQMVSIQLEMKSIIRNDQLENPLIVIQRNRLRDIKTNIVESINNQASTDKIQENFLNNQIKNIETQLNQLPAAERQYISIKRNYSLLENLYIFLLQKQAEAGISKAANSSDITVVNPPKSGGAVSPNTSQNYMIAALMGTAFPFVIIILFEIFNIRVQSREDVEKITNIPFIGGVGHKKTEDNRVVLALPKSAVAESFRALRSNLSYFTKGKENCTVLITSSISGEGKTFTTINLATVLAFSGKKTLIVGADLRRPKLYSDFNLSNAVGLSSYLAGLNTFDETLQFTNQENLFLISGGPVPPNPSELILGERMSAFFAEAKRNFNYIIVDSPPLAIVADAFVLTEHCDHMLFVVRQNFTPKNMLRSIEDHFRTGRIKDVSVVLNDIYKSGPGYGYGYGYGYSYGYGIYGKKKNADGYYSES